METEFFRMCPCCGDKIHYQSEITLIRADKDNSNCKSCMVILRNPNVIDQLTHENKYDFSAGEIIRYIYTFPKEKRNNIAVEILKLCNPQIEYNIIGKLSSRTQNIEYNCSIHNDYITTTSFRHVIERHQGCRQCKGQKPQGFWKRPDVLINSMKELILTVYEKTSCTFHLTNYFDWDRALVQAWLKANNKPSQEFYKLIGEMGLPNPKTDCYLKDGNIFRGFFEFVGYCLIKEWEIPFEYSPKVFDKYLSDGYFTELNVHWEHWGELNKNNSEKKKLYLNSSFGLFETFDKDCRNKGGIKYLHNTLKDFLNSKGYTIPEMTHEEILGCIKGGMSNFDSMMDNVLLIIKKFGWDEKIVENELRPIKEGNIILAFINKFFNSSILDFKLYLNKNYNFNYSITAKRGSYQDYKHFISEINPFINKFGYIPKQDYFAKIKRNDIPVMATRMFGGLNNLKKNEIEEGPFFYLVKDMYNSKIPNDRQLIWDGDENYNTNVHKVLNYYKNLGYEFPNTMNTLRYDKRFYKFGPTLHSAISRQGGWKKFVDNYKY